MTTVMSKNPPPPPMHKQTDANNGALNIEDATVTSNAGWFQNVATPAKHLTLDFHHFRFLPQS